MTPEAPRPSASEPKGNYEFTVYVEDRNEPGTGDHRFWIEVISGLALPRDAVDNAIDLGGGNIVAPHQGRQRPNPRRRQGRRRSGWMAVAEREGCDTLSLSQALSLTTSARFERPPNYGILSAAIDLHKDFRSRQH